MLQCPCQSDLTYSQCCEPLHNNTQYAKNPLVLMRSRFCAFYLGSKAINAQQMIQYLQRTSSIETSSEALQDSFTTNWQGLHIVNWQNSKNTGVVEFVAIYKNDDQYLQLHEKSQFTYHKQWLYSSGEILADYSFARNKPCWCASGKKYKHCHGK